MSLMFQVMAKRGKYGSWAEEDLQKAMAAVSEKRLGLNKGLVFFLFITFIKLKVALD